MIVDNNPIYYRMNYHHACKRVSLGLLARNYSSDLQLNPPGPVTPARQQVLDDLSIKQKCYNCLQVCVENCLQVLTVTF